MSLGSASRLNSLRCSAETSRGKTRTPPVSMIEVVIAAAEALAAIFDHPQPAPLGAIFGRQLLEPDHAVRDAVHGLVVRLAGQVVEHQHGRAAAREIMLQRQDLAPIAQRALRQQPDFRQAVEHDRASA